MTGVEQERVYEVSRQRLPGLDGLRALAAASVTVYHVWLFAAPDARVTKLGALDKPAESLRAGVALFFVLSGFLLYRSFVGAIVRGQNLPSVRRYLRNRALRILPAYWVALLFLAVVVKPEMLTAPDHLVANLVLVQNYVPRYMPSFNGGEGIYGAWSLAIEAVFYLALPVLAFVGARMCARSPWWASLAPPLLLLLLGALAEVAQYVLDDPARQVWRFAFPPFAQLFALGMLLAIARVLWEDGRLPLPRAFTAVAATLAVVASLVATKLWYSIGISVPEYYSLMGLAAAAILAIIVLRPTAACARIFDSPVARSVGTASYSLFLIHGPVIRALRNNGLTSDGRVGFIYNLLLVAVAVTGATFLLYVSVERPILRRKSRSRIGDRAAFAHAGP